MSMIKKLAGETAIYGLSHVMSRVINFAVMAPYLTSQFPDDSSEYGIYSDIYSYSAILLTLLLFRLDTALFRFGSKSGDTNKTLGAAMIPMAVGLVAVLLINLAYGSNLASWLGYGEAPHYVHWLVYILCFDALASMIYAKLRLESRPLKFLIFRVGNVLLNVLLIFVFYESIVSSPAGDLLEAKLGMVRKVDYVFLANLVTSAITLLAMTGEYLKVKINYNPTLVKKMLWYAAPLVIVGIAGNINQTFSTPIQKSFLGDATMDNLADAGVYAAASKLAILLSLFTTAFNYAAEPFFFKNVDKKNATEVYGVVALAFTMVACLGALGIVAYLDILIMMFPASYRVGAPIVPYLLIAYVLLGIYYNVSIWYKLKDKTHIGAMISVAGMLVTLAVSITLLPSVGTIASAYAAVACYAVMVSICYVVGQRYFPVHYPLVRMVSYMLAAMALGSVMLWLRPNTTAVVYYGVVTALLLLYTTVAWKLDGKKAVSI